MKLSNVRIKNYRSIKDSGEITLSDNIYVLAGQNESGKSSILEALKAYQDGFSTRDSLNFELENDNKLAQEISCTYDNFDDSFMNTILEYLLKLVNHENKTSENIDLPTIINEKIISSIDKFTISRHFDFSKEKMLVTTKIDETTLGKIKKHINRHDIITKDNEKEISESKPYLDVDFYESEIAEIFFNHSLKFIFFNDFTALLPDKILLNDIDKVDTEGYVAVQNLAKLLRKDFKTIAQKIERQRRSLTEDESAIISANFQDDWQQKIYGNNTVKIIFDIQNNEIGKKEIIFSIQTKEHEYLAPRKRSKGMIWFLSLWLELKAKEKEKNLLLMFDEPGLHLHIKANKDMLKVFHKLVNNGHQIIYSTHSPSLIETDKLHNIGLVINTEDRGTIVEGLTTTKINTENKKDALQPIAEAMGLEPLKDFSILKEKNVLLEGISDFWYLQGMAKLLGRSLTYGLVPGVGIKGNQLHPLISFCLGYGLEWLIVMDNGTLPQKLREDLKNNLFTNSEDETNNKIFLIPVDEIENLFDEKDIIRIDSTIKERGKKPLDLIGQKNKIVFSKLFLTKVMSDQIKKSDIQTTTLEKFEEIFKWIENHFK